jgi:hypothetical protein
MQSCVRRLFIASLVLVAMLAGTRAEAQVAVASVTKVTVGPKLSEFQLAVSNYFRVPERDVATLSERRIREAEMPVVLFIAQKASLAPTTVVDLRARGYSWWDISVRYRIGPEAYYVPVAGSPGPPYGHAYGYYRSKPRSQWNTIVLADADIVNLVHLRFLTEHYHVTPQRVMEVRGRTADFVAVQREISGRGNSRGGDR